MIRPEADLSIFHVHFKLAYRQAVIDLSKKGCDKKSRHALVQAAADATVKDWCER